MRGLGRVRRSEPPPQSKIAAPSLMLHGWLEDGARRTRWAATAAGVRGGESRRKRHVSLTYGPAKTKRWLALRATTGAVEKTNCHYRSRRSASIEKTRTTREAHFAMSLREALLYATCSAE